MCCAQINGVVRPGDKGHRCSKSLGDLPTAMTLCEMLCESHRDSHAWLSTFQLGTESSRKPDCGFFWVIACSYCSSFELSCTQVLVLNLPAGFSTYYAVEQSQAMRGFCWAAPNCIMLFQAVMLWSDYPSDLDIANCVSFRAITAQHQDRWACTLHGEFHGTCGSLWCCRVHNVLQCVFGTLLCNVVASGKLV